MSLAIVAALALAAQAKAASDGTPVESDLEYARPIAGDWTYSATASGSEATFANRSHAAQVTIRCVRSTRRVSILKAVSASSPTLWVWTSSEVKSLPATYDSATARVRAELGANDPLLDAIASSRGRIGFSTSGLPALVVPAWPEVSRVIEDCRV